jgi:hypothetical protein
MNRITRETERASVQDFNVLGLGPDVSSAEVKKAYRELVKRWHPDHFQQRPSWERKQAEEKFKEITTSYRRISHGWKFQEARKQPQPSPSSTSSSTGAGSASGRPAALSSFIKRHIRPSSPGLKVVFSVVVLFLFSLTYLHSLKSWPDWLGLRNAPHLPADQTRPSTREIEAAPKALPPGGKQPSAGEQGPSKPLSRSTQPDSLTYSPSPPLSSHFTLGSTEADVLSHQGLPTRIQGQTWVYGLSEVQFKNGRVVRYNNFDGSLRVRLDPPILPHGDIPPFFTLGSTTHEVLLVQGTPTRIDNHSWFYGFSEVRFRTGRVVNYDNYFGNLKIRVLPSTSPDPAAHKTTFTVGSTKDDVLAVQGTPTSIQGNLWFYQLSNVLFREGRVQHVVNSGGNLRFTPLDEISKQSNESG